MGLLNMLHTRATQYYVTDTETGASETFTINHNLAPDWSTGAGYSGAMGIPGVWRASNLSADTLAALPWDALRRYGNRPVESISAPLLEQPNPPDVRITSFSSLFLDLFFHGNGVGIYATRNAEGWPTSLIPVGAANTVVRYSSWGDPFPEGTLVYQVGNKVYKSEDVFHVKGPCEPGSLRGMGILEAHLNTLNLAHELNRQARNVGSAAVPTGMMYVDDETATPEDLKAGKKMWEESQRSRSVAFIKKGKYVPLAWNPTETQLIEARKFTLTDIANMFGLDPSWLGGAQTSRVYSNIEQEDLHLLKFTLGGHLARFEQTLSTAFPRGTSVKANLNALLRPDTLTRYQAYEVGLRNGFLTLDEVRALEDRPPLPPVTQQKELENDASGGPGVGEDEGESQQ